MKVKKGIITGCIVFLFVSVLTLTSPGQTGKLSESMNQVYPFAADGRISLENINGNVRVAVWDRNEVRVEAVKYAYAAERLAEAKIEITAEANAIYIKTQYSQRSRARTHDDAGDYRDSSASVEYTLTIPRQAAIDKMDLINGALDIEGVAGAVKASLINGRVTARQLTGAVSLSTINGMLEASFEQVSGPQRISLNSVNGSVVLTVPAGVSAELQADTVHGQIENTLGLEVKKGRNVGRHLSAMLGGGGASIKLGNVNGSISIRN